MQYYIIDDDAASRRMLSRIIIDDLLGDVIGETGDANEAEIDIINNNPDLVLIDLLMPGQDGIETIQNLKKRNYKGKFVMISQVENKEMVEKSYNEGIEYFIHKPINRVEVASVINKIIEQIKMETSLSKIKESLAIFQTPTKEKKAPMNSAQILINILGDLGIMGENGSHDLIDIIEYLHKSDKGQAFMSDYLSLKELYVAVLSNKQKNIEEKDIKSFEQRLRRTVNQAMTNLASLGLTDYSHPKFEHYATKFFDFNEIRIRMRELDKNFEIKKAKINLKKFIYVLYNEMTTKIE